MNLQKLFEAQAELDQHIIEKKGLQGVDLLPNLILALQVELGECCNEWRGFKHWSDDREPRTSVYTTEGANQDNAAYIKCCENNHAILRNEPEFKMAISEGICPICNDSIKLYRLSNPLLEEYVDCLHFILSIGNQIEFDQEIDDRYISDSITRQFNFIFEDVSKLMKSIRMRKPKADLKAWYEMIIEGIIGLGEMLGFTWDQIEESYFEKNRINHERQNNGY
ncbi:dUTP diphosphatase [Heyndrickxia coagulans]|uniref:Dimeric dUTPase n=1 Tax=Heyndrickxia coagulans TaxID=1398 RepID=A0A150K540_HEYCO|nr:dUTP diphosphatase [Heyndrickxia coagulans]KYC64700.1 Dimeric dUTPase [Heyndrickxia coagulans]